MRYGNFQPSTLRHRLYRVGEQIRDHLLDLERVYNDGWTVFRRLKVQADTLREGKSIQSSLEDAPDGELFSLRLPGLGKLQQIVHNAHGGCDLPLDQIQVLTLLDRGVLADRFQEVDRVGDHAKGVAHLMRHAAGQLPHCAQALLAQQFLLGLPKRSRALVHHLFKTLRIALEGLMRFIQAGDLLLKLFI